MSAGEKSIAQRIARRQRFVVEWSGNGRDYLDTAWHNADPTKLHANAEFANQRADELRKLGLRVRVRPILQ